MAKIPLGDFGNAILKPGPQVQVVPGAFDNGGAALADAGDFGMRLASQEMERQRQENEALNRARAANAVLDRDIQVRTLQADIETRLQSGELRYDDAGPAFDSAMQMLDPPEIGALDPATRENLDKGLKRVEFIGRHSIRKASEDAKGVEFRGQTDAALDKLAKLAGMPGADVAAVNAQVDALDLIGQVGYGKGWEKKKQDLRDSNWANHAVQRAIASRDSLEEITQLEKDLSEQGGYYIDKLDTDKRNAVLSQVTNSRIQFERRAEIQQAKRDTKAERALNDIDKQIASGVPATAEMWTGWASTVKGTEYEQEFKARIAEEIEVQNVLRQPIDKQLGFVQEKERKLLSEGGSVRDKANLERMKTAVEKNVKQLQEAPLLFNQARTGDAVEPLALETLGTASPVIDQQLRDRVATISAMRKQYGQQVQNRPLLPQEVSVLSTVLEKGSYKQRSEILKSLRQSFGDDESYIAAMQQLAPDSPVRAMAGIIAAKERSLTLERNTFSPDIITKPGDVSNTLLMGEDLLNKSKAQKTEDGVSKGYPVPPEKEFKLAFADAAGNVFAGRPGAYDIAMQAVRAYYTGRAAVDGDVSGEVDFERMKHAVTAVLGSVVDFNGNGEVLAPWGMEADDFEQKAQAALNGELVRLNIKDLVGDKLDMLALKNRAGSTYFVVKGREYLLDRNNRPVVIDLDARPSGQAVSGKVAK